MNAAALLSETAAPVPNPTVSLLPFDASCSGDFAGVMDARMAESPPPGTPMADAGIEPEEASAFPDHSGAFAVQRPTVNVQMLNRAGEADAGIEPEEASAFPGDSSAFALQRPTVNAQMLNRAGESATQALKLDESGSVRPERVLKTVEAPSLPVNLTAPVLQRPAVVPKSLTENAAPENSHVFTDEGLAIRSAKRAPISPLPGRADGNAPQVSELEGSRAKAAGLVQEGSQKQSDRPVGLSVDDVQGQASEVEELPVDVSETVVAMMLAGTVQPQAPAPKLALSVGRSAEEPASVNFIPGAGSEAPRRAVGEADVEEVPAFGPQPLYATQVVPLPRISRGESLASQIKPRGTTQPAPESSRPGSGQPLPVGLVPLAQPVEVPTETAALLSRSEMTSARQTGLEKAPERPAILSTGQERPAPMSAEPVSNRRSVIPEEDVPQPFRTLTEDSQNARLAGMETPSTNQELSHEKARREGGGNRVWAGGISTARQVERMNTGTEEVEFADPVGKSLPGRTGLPTGSSMKPDQSEALSQLASKFTLEPAVNRPAVVSELEALSPVNQTARIEAAERLKAVISQEVTLLKTSGAGSLAVMLRPDAETEVFVQLTRHNGQVEAFVRLEKGDATEFRQNWERLQSSLADQQIKLLPLQAADFSSRQERGSQHDGNNFQDREQTFQQPSGFDRRNGGQPRGREMEPAMPQPALAEASGRSRSTGTRTRALDSWA